MQGRLGPEAWVFILDVTKGRLFASQHLVEIGHTLATPGSALKPVALYGFGGQSSPGGAFHFPKHFSLYRRELDVQYSFRLTLLATVALPYGTRKVITPATY